MIAYFDTSCLTMLVVEDPRHDALRRWMNDAAVTPTYSDFGWGELVSAISIRVRSKTVTIEHGHSAIDRAAGFVAGWSRFPIDGADILTATDFVARFDLKLRLPDAIHIAIAQRLGVILVTSDNLQADAAIALGIPVFNPLDESPS